MANSVDPIIVHFLQYPGELLRRSIWWKLWDNFLQLSIQAYSPSNEYPQHMVLCRNKKKYPRIITNYSSLIIPLNIRIGSTVLDKRWYQLYGIVLFNLSMVCFDMFQSHKSHPRYYGSSISKSYCENLLFLDENKKTKVNKKQKQTPRW